MEKPTPPRSRPWRWMILLSRFFFSFVCLGNFKAMGVFLPHFVETFSTDTATAGLVCSALLGFGFFTTGPFVGALLKVWSARKLTVAGGALAGICTVAASFSSSMTQLAVWFALMSIGLACIQVASIKPLMDYFPDNFATVNGVSFAGGTLGMIVLPPVLEYLVLLYGWRPAFALMGAFTFNTIACGGLLRPLSQTAATHNDVNSRASASGKRSGELSAPKASPSKAKAVFSTILEVLRERFDAELLAEPIFIIYQVVNVFNGMVYVMWHLFLIPQGLELGYGEAPSAFLATYGGVGSLIGRLGHGTLVDRGLIKASTLLALSSLLFAAACGLNPLALSPYAALATVAFVSGIAIGAIYPLAFVLMREVTGDERMSAYGWVFVSHGAGRLLGGYFGGWIHDIAGAYEFVFVAVGTLAVLMAAILVLTRCLVSCCETRD